MIDAKLARIESCGSSLPFVQVFLDVVESVNILVGSNGQVVRSEVVGALKMRTYLRWVAGL